MIDQDVKEKLGLKDTGISTGNSFVYGLEILEYPEFTTDERKVYIADCDRYGEPLKEGYLECFAKQGRYWQKINFPVEFVRDLDLSIFKGLIQEAIVGKLQSRENTTPQ